MAIDDHVEELLALAELGDDVDELGLLVDLVDLEQRGVVLSEQGGTRAFRSDISLSVTILARGNLRALIFLMARVWPVASCCARNTSP